MTYYPTHASLSRLGPAMLYTHRTLPLDTCPRPPRSRISQPIASVCLVVVSLSYPTLIINSILPWSPISPTRYGRQASLSNSFLGTYSLPLSDIPAPSTTLRTQTIYPTSSYRNIGQAWLVIKRSRGQLGITPCHRLRATTTSPVRRGTGCINLPVTVPSMRIVISRIVLI